MEFKLSQEIEIKEGKFVITSIEPTPQGSANIRFRNLKDGRKWIRGQSILSNMIKSFEKEQIEKERKKEEKRKSRRKEKFLRQLKEAEIVDPYIGEGSVRDQKIQYYRSLSYLAKNAEIDAYIAYKVREWFDEKYFLIKNKYPEGRGYYPHDEDVNKWSSELRIKFNLPDGKTTDDVVFGPDVGLVLGGVGYDFYINSNNLCWYLLSLGFDLGKKHNIEEIKSHIPDIYIKYFEEGLGGN